MHPPGPWDDFLVRCIGLYKIVKAICAIALGITLLCLAQRDIPDMIHDWATLLRLNAEGPLLNYIIDKARSLTPFRMEAAADLVFVYSVVFAVEGYGLYNRKTWAEYLVSVSTAIPLPFEIGALCYQPGIIKTILLIGNAAILIFLIRRILEERVAKRLLLEAHTTAAAEPPAAPTP